MDATISEFEQELKPGAGFIAITFLGLAVILTLLSEARWLPDGNAFIVVAGIFYPLAALVWLSGKWRTNVARWIAVMGLMAVILMGAAVIGMDAFSFFLVTPVALSILLLDPRSTTGVTIVESLALVQLDRVGVFNALPGGLTLALLAIWGVWGVLLVGRAPWVERLNWLWSHYQEVEKLLSDAQKDRGRLFQALDDLALANRQLNLLNERLEIMYAVAEGAKQSKSAFVAKVSHELRTPLNMVIGLMDVISETPEVYDESLPPTLLNDLEIVRRNAEHLASMINDILDLSQAESGQLMLHREWVDMAAEVGKASKVILPLLEKKRLTLRTSIPDDLPEVYCDRTRIRQVVLNLVSNAARYTDVGEITVAVESDGREVVVRVTDTGPGLQPDQAERIFEPFYRARDEAWKEQHSGSGLGLSISKQFIEAHHGSIWLETEVGVGSTFAFRLPVSPSLLPMAPGPRRWIGDDWVWRERTSWPQLPEMPYQNRVVILDETATLQTHLDTSNSEVELVLARTGDDVLEAVRQCPAHVIIVNAPRMEQLQTLVDDLRGKVPSTPIIGCAFPVRPQQGLEEGILRYLIKPVVRADMEEALQALPSPVRRVLIVDDVPDVRHLFARMLHSVEEDIVIDAAATGKDALEAMKRGRPDLVLLDVILPDMDGWQVLKRKKYDAGIADIPTIMVSAEDPNRQPMRSDLLMTSIGSGFSITDLMNCSLALSEQLLHAPPASPVPGRQ